MGKRRRSYLKLNMLYVPGKVLRSHLSRTHTRAFEPLSGGSLSFNLLFEYT